MSGLVLKLAAGESFVVNGAVVENCDKPTRIRIADADARVLRCRDALRPEEVDTPVKRVYYAIQLLITGDLEEDNTLPAIDEQFELLQDVFATINAGLVPKLREMVSRGNYYSALCQLRHLVTLEAELFRRGGVETQPAFERKVA
ncbi:MAG: flagellar biosynthesis repressor FlbT [Pseudomonadota bacterium]